MCILTSQVSFHGGPGSCFVRPHFAVVIKLLIAGLTQLLLRAFIISCAVVAASVRLLGAGIIIILDQRRCALQEEQAGREIIELFVFCAAVFVAHRLRCDNGEQLLYVEEECSFSLFLFNSSVK